MLDGAGLQEEIVCVNRLWFIKCVGRCMETDTAQTVGEVVFGTGILDEGTCV